MGEQDPELMASSHSMIYETDRELARPFRDDCLDETELGKVTAKLESDEVKTRKVKTRRVLLLGLSGHGKSSVVNTVHSSLRHDGKVKQITPAGQAAHCVTTEYREHQLELAEGSRDNSPLLLCDIPGFSVDGDGISLEDIEAVLNGLVPHRYKFPPREDAQYRKKPRMKDKTHVVGLCVDAAELTSLTGAKLEKIKNVISVILKRRLQLVIILTKTDVISPLVAEDPSMMFKSSKVRDAVREAATKLGVSENQVYPVKNYYSETKCVPAVSILALSLCVTLLESADIFVEQKENDGEREGPPTWFGKLTAAAAVVAGIVLVIALNVLRKKAGL